MTNVSPAGSEEFNAAFESFITELTKLGPEDQVALAAWIREGVRLKFGRQRTEEDILNRALADVASRQPEHMLGSRI